MKTEILYEDSDILIIHKPAGLATQTSAVGQPDVVSELKGYLAREGAKNYGKSSAVPYLGIVHRLDQPVEGLLVFGKNEKATAALTKQLCDGGLHKKYYALVCGRPPEEAELVDYLVKQRDNTVQIVTGREKQYPDAKRAVLSYKLIGGDEECSLLDVTLQTGRFHQIRAQLSGAGYPILGDRKYGTEFSQKRSVVKGIRWIALFAYELCVCHPVTGKEMKWTAHSGNPAFANLPF